MNESGQAVIVGLAATCLCYLYGLGFSWRVAVLASVAEFVRRLLVRRFILERIRPQRHHFGAEDPTACRYRRPPQKTEEDKCERDIR
jgi:hypothetical protein